jgi:hypothetical protein
MPVFFFFFGKLESRLKINETGTSSNRIVHAHFLTKQLIGPSMKYLGLIN